VGDSDSLLLSGADDDEQAVAERIHAASLELLSDPGVRFEHDGIVEMLIAAGGKPGAAAQTVRIPPEMVDETLARCPSQVHLADRAGGGKTISARGGQSFWSVPALKIFEDGESRNLTCGDMARFARILDGLDNVDVVFGLALEDVVPPARDAVGLCIMAENTTKHLRPLSFSPEGAQVMVEMKEVVGGHPWFSIGFTAHGPLRWTNLALEIYSRTAGHGIPATVNGEPMAGVSAPVTLAGTAAVGNAEILAGIVVNQLLEPGRPLIHNLGLAHVFDMKTAIAVTGGPENHLLARAGAVMARFYNLPSASWVSTESMCPDEQAALEKMCGWLSHVRSGVSAIWGVGQLESEISVSPAQAVIDDEMISYVKRYVRGFRLDGDCLAVDLAREVGITGSFLDKPHTALNFRDELYFPGILWRARRADWEKNGSRSLEERAAAKAGELAAAEPESGLDEDQVRELRRLSGDFAQRMKNT